MSGGQSQKDDGRQSRASGSLWGISILFACDPPRAGPFGALQTLTATSNTLNTAQSTLVQRSGSAAARADSRHLSRSAWRARSPSWVSRCSRSFAARLPLRAASGEPPRTQSRPSRTKSGSLGKTEPSDGVVILNSIDESAP